MFLNGEDVSGQIRTEQKFPWLPSDVSAIRLCGARLLLDTQRSLAEKTMC